MTPDALALIHKAAFRESRPWESQEFRSLLKQKFCFCLGDSRGFALGRAIAGECELLTVAVVPKFQRQGVGRALMQAYHTEALNRGSQQCFLEVAKDNINAINLYLSDGYTQVAERKNYYTRPNGQTVDALILSRNLT